MKLKPHIISINESWLKCSQKGKFTTLLNYTFISNSRTNNKGGGVGLHIDKSLSFCNRDDLTMMKEKICETLFIDIRLNDQASFEFQTRNYCFEPF